MLRRGPFVGRAAFLPSSRHACAFHIAYIHFEKVMFSLNQKARQIYALLGDLTNSPKRDMLWKKQ